MARPFQQILEQPELGRSEIDVAFAASRAKRYAIKLKVAGIEAVGDALRTAAAQASARTLAINSGTENGLTM